MPWRVPLATSKYEGLEAAIWSVDMADRLLESKGELDLALLVCRGRWGLEVPPGVEKNGHGREAGGML